jgi:hypothetical protein
MSLYRLAHIPVTGEADCFQIGVASHATSHRWRALSTSIRTSKRLQPGLVEGDGREIFGFCLSHGNAGTGGGTSSFQQSYHASRIVIFAPVLLDFSCTTQVFDHI